MAPHAHKNQSGGELSSKLATYQQLAVPWLLDDPLARGGWIRSRKDHLGHTLCRHVDLSASPFRHRNLPSLGGATCLLRTMTRWPQVRSSAGHLCMATHRRYRRCQRRACRDRRGARGARGRSHAGGLQAQVIRPLPLSSQSASAAPSGGGGLGVGAGNWVEAAGIDTISISVDVHPASTQSMAFASR